jgi:hypothetical protein
MFNEFDAAADNAACSDPEPWWFNTDEVVFYCEVVRQLRFDPTLTFFDIPGTPYVSLIGLVTLFWWAAERVFRLTTAVTPADLASKTSSFTQTGKIQIWSRLPARRQPVCA